MVQLIYMDIFLLVLVLVLYVYSEPLPCFTGNQDIVKQLLINHRFPNCASVNFVIERPICEVFVVFENIYLLLAHCPIGR